MTEFRFLYAVLVVLGAFYGLILIGDAWRHHIATGRIDAKFWSLLVVGSFVVTSAAFGAGVVLS